MTKILGQTENGSVFICSTCNRIHFEYNNLSFNFTDKEYKHFSKYILRLDGEYWEMKNANNYFKRKISIPIGHSSFNIVLNNKELMELKELFSKSNKKFKTPSGLFNYNFNSN